MRSGDAWFIEELVLDDFVVATDHTGDFLGNDAVVTLHRLGCYD